MLALMTVTLAAGCADETRPAVGIHVLLSQVRKAFKDDMLRSASVKGSTLTVTVAVPHQLSVARAGFEAKILAAAFHDAVSASGRTPISVVRVVNSNGRPVDGSPVGDDNGLGRVSAGQCKNIAETVQTSSLVIRSALTLPYAGGGCAFTFQTSRQATFDPQALGKLAHSMSYPSERPFIVEVDDSAGAPLYVLGWTEDGGGFEGATPASHIWVCCAPTGPKGPTGATGLAGPTGARASR